MQEGVPESPVNRLVGTVLHHLCHPCPPLPPLDAGRKQADISGSMEVALACNESAIRQQEPSSAGGDRRTLRRALSVVW
jgi:hypothetical protein